MFHDGDSHCPLWCECDSIFHPSDASFSDETGDDSPRNLTSTTKTRTRTRTTKRNAGFRESLNIFRV